MSAFRSASREVLSFLLSAVLGASVLMACLSAPGMAPSAQAVVNRGSMSVSVPGSLSLAAGESTSVACTVSPASDYQTPNCSTSYCPSGCGPNGQGCLDDEGQCTCISSARRTYKSSATASSSNPSVARATYYNGVLYVDAYSAGTATIEVVGSLRLWTSAYAYVTVNVSAPQQVQPTPSSGSSDSGVSGSSSGSGANVAGSVSVSQSGVTSTSSTAHVLSALVAGGNAAKVEEGAEAEVEEMQLAKIGEADPAEALGAVAGTNKTVCFWHGDSIESADFMWSFAGADVSAEAAAKAADFDFGVSVASDEDDELAAYLNGKKSISFKFASYAFPAPATFAYQVASVFSGEDRVNLYYWDEKARELVMVAENIEVTEGYATTKIDHGGVYVLSDDATLAGPVAKQAAEAAQSKEFQASTNDPAGDESSNEKGLPIAAIAAGVAVVVAVAAGVAYGFIRSRKKSDVTAGVQSESSESNESVASEEGDK